MPQTREHLAILDLLRVEQGAVVITKKDLVDEEWLELVTLEVKETIQNTALNQVPILAVSAITKEGLPELVSTIDSLLDSIQPSKDIGRPRLPVDRIFSIAGFGTVVTGTLIDGSLSLGQEVEILPARLKSRIRGLQTHKQKLDTVLPGSRVAANLTGVTTDELKRGDVLAHPGTLIPTRAIDGTVRLLPDVPRPLVHNVNISFHTGSSEVMGKLRLLDKEKLQPGETGWAQFLLAQPIAVLKGDLFVFRSSNETLGGGEIVQLHAKRHRRFRLDVIESLRTREKGTPEEVVFASLETKGPVELGTLSRQCNLPLDDVERAAQALAAEKKVMLLGGKGTRALVLSATGWNLLVERVKQIAQDYHQQFPLRHGILKEELRTRLRVPPSSFAGILSRLLQENLLVEKGLALGLPSHQIQPNEKQKATIAAFLGSLARNPYSPPSELMPEPELLNLLIEQHEVVKVKEGIVFSASAYNEIVKGIVDHLKSQGKITVAEMRDMFHTSRRYALALLEHLDDQKVTRRSGDDHVLR